MVPRPQPNGRGHLTGAIGETAGSASTFGARHGRVNSVRRNPGLAFSAAVMPLVPGDRIGAYAQYRRPFSTIVKRWCKMAVRAAEDDI